MWFGTSDGLNKYDGYNFKVYKNDPENPNSLSSNYVTSIYEDKSGVLWIGTNFGGLNIFNREKEQFTHFQNDPNDPNSLSHNDVSSIYEDKSGVLWIGTYGGGLNKLVPSANEESPPTFIHYQADPNDPNSLSDDDIRAVYEDKSGVLWIGTYSGGLNKLVLIEDEGFDQEKEQFIHYKNDLNDPNSLSNNYVKSIYENRAGILWIGTVGGGLNIFNREKEEFIRYKNDPNNPSSLSNNFVRSIYEDKSGVLWIGTRGGGLNKLVPSVNEESPPTFIHYQADPNDPDSLSSNSVLSICEDRSGVLWIGTSGGGFNKFNREKEEFIHFRNDPNNPNSLSSNSVLSICEDRSGVLWIGTSGGGLNKLVLSEAEGFDRKKEEFIFYRKNPNDPNSLSSNSVLSICEDRSGVLWIGTSGGGLNKLVPSANEESHPTFVHYKNDPNDPNSLSSNFINSIYEDRSGVLWIGTYGEGLNKFDRETEKFIRYQNDPNNFNSLSNNFVYSIYEDRSGVLWIGTLAGGLNKFDREKEQFVHYKNDASDPNSLSNNFINSIYEDRSGVLWIGTYGGGLNKFDRKKEVFTPFREKDGLPNNLIFGILEDEEGDLWLSTNKGLSRFNPRIETFKNYDVSDGLQSNEFNRGACHKSRSGEMFFGGINGFNAFYPDSIRDNPHIPPVVITDIQIFNKSVPIGKREDGRSILEKSITETKEIELSYKDYVFSFEFAALHYACPEKNEYAYIMEGFEKDWNYVGNRRFVTYTTLPPGDYVFRVKGSNNDGVWNEEGASLKIRVTPPFWQTWWFCSSGIIMILLVIFSVHQVRTHNIRERSKQLEKRVEERTTELNSANKELEDFAYIVSHDLKAPLRGVSQLATWISQDYAHAFDKDGKEQMNLLVGRVKRMSNLIGGILEYSRAWRTEQKEEEINLNRIAREAIGDIAPPDNIKVTIENELPVVLADRVRIEQVFQNLISNAVKYMDKPEGEIRISCVDEGIHWKISIEDNGPGIDEKYHDKIFQIFETLESRDIQESTGVGLSVVKKIVEFYGGRIWVKSKVGEGSTFFFTIKKLR